MATPDGRLVRRQQAPTWSGEARTAIVINSQAKNWEYRKWQVVVWAVCHALMVLPLGGLSVCPGTTAPQLNACQFAEPEQVRLGSEGVQISQWALVTKAGVRS